MNSSRKRVWIKKSTNGVPTTLLVGPDDLVDDLKTMVVQKYPTTLAREVDPADLIIRLDMMPLHSSSPSTFGNTGPGSSGSATSKKMPKSHYVPTINTSLFPPGSGPGAAAGQATGSEKIPISPIPISSTKSPLLPSNGSSFQRPSSRAEDDYNRQQSPYNFYQAVLRPDQNVWRIIEQYFPNGMTMNDAFVIESPSHIPPSTSGPVSLSLTVQNQHPSSMLPPTSATGFSPNFSSYLSPQRDSKAQLPPLATPNQKYKYNHSLSFSGEASRQQNSNRRTSSALSHRRSMSNPQSPSTSASFNTNTTILMLPKDYNGNGKESKQPGNTPHHQSKLSDEFKTAGKVVELKKDSDLIPRSASPTLPISNTQKKKIKTTTEKVFPSINILIVEDNKINQKILQAFLRKRKISFQTAVNGEEAIEKWRQGGFHLVLMDIQLPMKSGIEAAIEIRRLEKLNGIGLFSKSGSNLPKPSPQDELDLTLFRSPVIIVALTASTSSLDRQKALAAGCNDYLTKPVNLDWLQNKITEWGCMQLLINFDHWKD